jgi:hypothetical protein
LGDDRSSSLDASVIQRSTVESLVVALIVGGLSLLGVIFTQRGESSRSEERLELQARGAARNLMQEIHEVELIEGQMYSSGRVRRIARRIRFELPHGDMQIVAAILTPAEYKRVFEAVTNGKTFAEYVDGRRKEELGRPLRCGVLRRFQADLFTYARAIGALSRITKLKRTTSGVEPEQDPCAFR